MPMPPWHTGQPAKKRNLESVPDLFVGEPEAKRRADQELAYNTLKECVVELRHLAVCMSMPWPGS
jgi:hypothetical protein